MSKLHYLFFLLLIGFFVSCEDVRYHKDKASLLRNVLLLQMNYDSQSLDKENHVYYPYDEFVCEHFVRGLTTHFNSNTNNFSLQIPTFTFSKADEKSSKLLKNTYLRDEKEFLNNLGIVGLVDHTQIPKKLIKEILSNYQATSYLVINFNTSVWRQDFSGNLQVFSPDGEMIFHYGIKKKNSKYIIYDSASPYLIRENSFFQQDINQTSTHAKEIQHMYNDLGKVIANSLKKIMTRVDKKLRKKDKK